MFMVFEFSTQLYITVFLLIVEYYLYYRKLEYTR